MVAAVLNRPTLVLNRSWQPVGVASVSRSLVLLWNDNARVVDPQDYDAVLAEMAANDGATSSTLRRKLAQAAFARGDNKTARELAERAKQRFPIGSPGWVRADDIVAFNKNHKQNPLSPGQ